MATTVHLSAQLLDSVDRRAHELGLSRNRYVVRALERTLAAETRWSPHFLEALDAAETDEEIQWMMDEMTKAIASNRTRKAPPPL